MDKPQHEFAKIHIIAPIDNPYLFTESEILNEGLDLGGVFFLTTPEWLNDKDKFKKYSDVEMMEQYVPALCYSRFAYSVTLEAPYKKVQAKGFSYWAPDIDKESIIEKFILANFSLWLSNYAFAGFNHIFLISEEDKMNLTNVLEVNGFWANEFESLHTGERVEKSEWLEIYESDFLMMKIFFSKLSVVPRSCTLWIALRAIFTALSTKEWEVRYLMLWVALEALFGPEDGKELNYRLSQRISLILTNDNEKRKELFYFAKKSYHLRSKIVHGMRVNFQKELDYQKSLYETENLVRQLLRAILLDDNLLDNFIGYYNREKFLEELLFK